MRLIDADILPRHGNRGGLVRWSDIEDAPTIDIVRHGYWTERYMEDAPIVYERKAEGMKIGDEVYIHGYIDEIRPGTIIIRNDGGYFGTISDEVFTIQELKHEDEENKQA